MIPETAHRFLHFRSDPRRSLLLPVILISTVLLFALLSLNIGPENALLLFGLGCGVVTVTIIALWHPRITIVLVFLTGMILDGGANSLLPAMLQTPSLGLLKLRYFDPILLGIVLALLIKLLLGDRRFFRAFISKQSVFSLLLVWLIAIAFLSSAKYGLVASLGEFRTYYQYFLLVPYIVVFFKTREEQWRLFKLLLTLGFLLIPWSLVSALLTPNLALFDLSGASRFIPSYINLALLCSVVGLYVAEKQGTIKIKNLWFRALVLSFVLVTLVNNHRSVWLATVVAFLLLFLSRRLSFRRMIELGLVMLVLGIGIGLAPSRFTQPVVDQFQKRTTAFTDFKGDASAYWRYYLWVEAIKEIKQHPIRGAGFGKDFQLYGPEGNLITTAPHNQYVTIAFEAGLTALTLYLLFILRTALRLFRAAFAGVTDRERTILWTVLIVLCASSAYYIAYWSDFFTWLMIGLGVAVLANRRYREHASS